MNGIDVILIHRENESRAESESRIGAGVSAKIGRNLISLDIVWLQEVRCTTNFFNMKKFKKTLKSKGDNTTNISPPMSVNLILSIHRGAQGPVSLREDTQC